MKSEEYNITENELIRLKGLLMEFAFNELNEAKQTLILVTEIMDQLKFLIVSQPAGSQIKNYIQELDLLAGVSVQKSRFNEIITNCIFQIEMVQIAFKVWQKDNFQSQLSSF